MIPRSLTIRVEGRPKPQKRPRTFRAGKGKKAKTITYSPSSDWKDKVESVSSTLRLDPKLSGPLAVDVTLFLPRPKCAKKRIYPNVRPDIDNYLKAVLDAVSDAEVWKDDGQVVRLSSAKLYATELQEPGAVIEIEELVA